MQESLYSIRTRSLDAGSLIADQHLNEATAIPKAATPLPNAPFAGLQAYCRDEFACFRDAVPTRWNAGLHEARGAAQALLNSIS